MSGQEMADEVAQAESEKLVIDQYIIKVSGKRVDMRRAFPVRVKDSIEVHRRGATPQAFEARDPTAGAIMLGYYINKANPEVTVDDVMEMSAKEFERAADIFRIIREQQDEDTDRPT